MENLSLWEAISGKPASYPTLTQNIEVDVAIIGAGITGITAALELINAGKKVAILEANQVSSGTTGFSTGNLYIAVQPYYQKIVKKFNEATAKTIAHSRQYAIDYIENNVNEKNINCNFSRRPWYLYTDDDKKISFLTEEVELIKKLDIPIDYTNELPLAFSFKKAATMPNQGRFNPVKYVRGIAAHLQKSNCDIFENSRVLEMSETKTGCILKTTAGQVTAKKVIIATHTPIGINPTQMFTAPYRSYVVAVHVKDKFYPEGHFWDLDEPHHATCTHAIRGAQPDLLLVAGNHHKTGQDKNTRLRYEELEAFLRKNFPVTELSYRWSAQHYLSADAVPYIGLATRFAKHTYMATGFFADGLIYGTLAGIIIANLISNQNNPLAKTYNSNRFDPIASAPFMIKENGNVFFQYLKDYPIFTKKNYDDIKMGEGKVVEIHREKFGVSRDEKNQLHIVSAVCTHMKCIVNWNNAEKTWDCPCHGSRFTNTGKVIEGPAISDLKAKE